MKATVIYESMYGNTHSIAEAIAQGLNSAAAAEVLSVEEARSKDLSRMQLLVIGGPTHAHGISRKPLREAAVAGARRNEKGLVIDPSTVGMGLREWLDSLGHTTGNAAAFDTRLDAPDLLTGHVSKGIAKKLEQHGFHLLAEPASFLVGKDNHLLPGEQDRARTWGARCSPPRSPELPSVGGDIPER